MPTLTIDLPETAYRAALTLPVHERARLAAILFTTETARRSSGAEAFANEGNEDDESGMNSGDLPDYDRPTNEDDLAAIERGLQAVAEGRTTPADVVFARYQERFGRK